MVAYDLHDSAGARTELDTVLLVTQARKRRTTS